MAATISFWDSYQNQQDLELEALTWTDRHLPTSASPYHICTYEGALLNAPSVYSINYLGVNLSFKDKKQLALSFRKVPFSGYFVSVSVPLSFIFTG